MKTLDPFDTGGLIFDFDLLVPHSALPEARAELDELSGEVEPLAHETELPSDFFAPEREGAEVQESLETCSRLSRRIRWGAVSWIGAPFAVAEFGPYLQAVRQLGHAPPNHRSTLLAFGFAIAQLAFFAILILTRDWGARGPP